MNKLSFLIVCLSISFILKAQIQKTDDILYENNFDLLPIGAYLAQSHPDWWTTWNNMPGTSEDAPISGEQVASFPHSAKCVYGTDLVFKAGNKKTGAYTIDFDMYILNNGSAYFNLLHIFNAANSEWALGIYFNYADQPSGTNIQHNGILTPFTFPFGSWFPVSIFVDLDNDRANIKINNIQYLECQFSTIETGGQGERQLAAAGFFPPQSGSLYYIDNFVYTSLTDESAPIMNVTPTFIYEEVAEGAIANITKQIIVANSGNSIGDYYTWLVYDFEPVSGNDVFTLKQCSEYNNSFGYTNGGLVELGVKFSGNNLCDKVGAYITKMSCYLADNIQNNSLKFRIYGPCKNDLPGEILMEFTKTGCIVGAWNEITLPQPLLIDKSELWLSVEFFHQEATFPMGMDGGPLKTGINFIRRNGGIWSELTIAECGNFLITAEATGTAIGCWLSLTGNTHGSISGGGNTNFNAVINPTGLDYDAYRANITITTSDLNNPEIKIPCTLAVLPSQPASIVYIAPTFIHETSSETGTITKQITVTNYGNAASDYNAWLEDVSDNWISLTGNTTGSITGGGNSENFNAVINTAELDNGNYTATLKISTTDEKHPLFTIPCTLVFEKPAPPVPQISVSPASINEIAAEAGVITRQITITNTGDAAGEYESSLESAHGWISLSGATTGTVLSENSETFDVLINPENLDNGTYAATIKITTNDPENELFEIPCSIIVSKENIEFLTTEIAIYPNPATDKVNIYIDNNIDGKIILEILDINGKRLLQKNVSEFSKILNIDMSIYDSGIYFIVIHADNLQFIRKIIKK